MGVTISGMTGAGSIRHNNRSFSAANVDRSRTEQNIVFCNEDLKQVYHMVFDEALAAYNAKKTKTRDKIPDYYEHIRQSISIHSLRMEGDSKTAQESVFHFAYPCTILQKRMQKTTFCTRKNGFFRKKGEKFGAKPSASFCAPMIRTDTFPLNFSHRISGSSMSMVSFAPICSTFD